MSTAKMPWPDLTPYKLMVTVMHDKSGNRALVVRPADPDEAPEKTQARAQAMAPKLNEVCQKLGEGQLNVSVLRNRFLVFTGPMVRNQALVNRFFGKLFPKSGTLYLTLADAESAEVVSQIAKQRFSQPTNGPTDPFDLDSLNRALPAGVEVERQNEGYVIQVAGLDPRALVLGTQGTNEQAAEQIQGAMNHWFANLDIEDNGIINERLVSLNRDLNKDNLTYWQRVSLSTEQAFYNQVRGDLDLVASLGDLNTFDKDDLTEAMDTLTQIIGHQGRAVRKTLQDKLNEVQSRYDELAGLGRFGTPGRDNVQENSRDNSGEHRTESGYRELGKNVEGETVIENDDGVRGYLLGGMISWEAVSLVPTANGYVTRPSREVRDTSYLTVEEALDQEPGMMPLESMLRAAFEVHTDGGKGWSPVSLNHNDEKHQYLIRSREPGRDNGELELVRLARQDTGTLMTYTERLTPLNERLSGSMPYPATSSQYQAWVAAGFELDGQEIAADLAESNLPGATMAPTSEDKGDTNDDTAAERSEGAADTNESGSGTVPDADGRPGGEPEQPPTDAGSAEPTDGAVLEQREQSGATGPGKLGGDDPEFERSESSIESAGSVGRSPVDADGTAGDGAGGRGSVGSESGSGADLPNAEQTVSGQSGADGHGGAVSGHDAGGNDNGVWAGDSRDLFGADGQRPDEADDADGRPEADGSDQSDAVTGNPGDVGVSAGGGTGEPEREPGGEAPGTDSDGLSDSGERGERDHDAESGADEQPDWESFGDNLTAEDFAGPERFVPESDENTRGPAQRLKDNLAALSLLHELETDGTEPTMEERAILAGYSGFGGIHADLFSNYAWGAPEWVKSGNQAMNELRNNGVISVSEYKSLRSTVLNAHYTHSGIIEPMWEALDKMGVPLERTLEPSAGTLNYKSFMPETVVNKVKYFTAVEYDPLTARLAQHIHPDARVLNSGFEKTKFPDNFFDCAISNIPFGDYRVFDPEHPERKQTIHNQFFLKGMDKVRPGGMVAFLTSAYMLDGTDNSVRQEIMDKAHVVGAYRLPTGTFKKSTGTEVMTDILFLQKKGNFEPTYEPLNILDTKRIEAPLASTSSVEYQDVTYEPGDMVPGQKINQVYVDHPELVVGNLGVVTSQHGPVLRVQGGGTISEQRDRLRNAFAGLPTDIATGQRETLTPEQIAQGIAASNRGTRDISELPGALRFDGSKFWAKDVGSNGRMTERQIDPPKSSVNRVATSIKAMESLSNLMALESVAVTDEQEKELNTLRAQARTDAEALIKLSNGKKPLAGAAKKILDGDGRAELLRGAVLVDNDNQWSLADIYHQRTVQPMTEAPTKADNLDDALALSLAYTARVSESYMARLLAGTNNPPTPEQIRNAMVAQGKAFIDPETNDLVERTDYLSGNLGPKLEMARNVANSDPSFQVNVDALQEAMPAPLKPSEIKVALDAFWLPHDIMQDFLSDGLGINTHGNFGVKAYFDDFKRHWRIEPTAERAAPSLRKIAEQQQHVARNRWGTERKNVFELLEFAYTNTTPKVLDPIPFTEPTRYQINTEESLKAQTKHEELMDAFNRWIFKSPARAQRLADIYNERFNTWVLHEPDGSHMVYPGMAESWVPRKHQNDFIWRAVSGKNCMTAHVVGAGKTMQLIGSAVRGKQMGRWNKPLCVVPNHMLEQFSNDAQSIFPGARVLAMTAADARADNRSAFGARCAMGDWDLVICTHSVFEKITVPKDFEARMIENELEKLRSSMEGDESKNYKEKEIEKAIKQLESRLERALEDVNDNKENALNMAQIGIDWVGVDEAHYYKNLMVDTAQQIPGVSNASSKRATNMLLKTQYLNEIHDGPYGVMMATGTPVSNSVTECYTFQRFLRPDLLQGMGIQNFNDWMGLFGEVKHGMELKPEGNGYQMKSRLSRFKNIPELVKTVRTFVDFKTREDLNLPTPSVVSETVVAPQSPFMKNFMQYIEARARNVRAGRDGGNSSAERIATEIRERLNKANDKTVIDRDTGEMDEDRIAELADDILLTIATDGRKASLDPRLIHPGLEDFENSKINQCVRKCVELYHQYDEQNAAQMLFCDFSSPTGKGIFNVYDDIKKKLINAGIPEDEIAFIHDAKSDADKEKLFSAVRSGEVRFLLGSTQKMGVGTNVQERLVAMHQLDPPWKPADIEQRLGRMDRQGNLFDEVYNFTYVTEDSFDLFMWETLNRKLRMTQQAMRRPEDCARDINEDTEVGYEEILAVTTGNPAIRDYMETRQAMDKLKRMHDSHVDQQADLAAQIHNQEKKVQNIAMYLDSKIAEQELVNRKLPLHIEFDDPQPGLRDGPMCTAGGLEGLAESIKHIAERAPSYRTIDVGTIGGLKLKVSRMSSAPRLEIERLSGQTEQIYAFLSQDEMFKEEEKYNSDGSINKNADENRNAAKALVRVVHKIATDNGIEKTRESLDNAKRNLKTMEEDLGAPFEYEKEMEDTRGRFKELSELLGDEIDSDKQMDPEPLVEMAKQITQQTEQYGDLPELARSMATNSDVHRHFSEETPEDMSDFEMAMNDDDDDQDGDDIRIG